MAAQTSGLQCINHAITCHAAVVSNGPARIEFMQGGGRQTAPLCGAMHFLALAELEALFHGWLGVPAYFWLLGVNPLRESLS